MKVDKLATWELKKMEKALTNPVSKFLNTEKENKLLEKVKRELKKRRNKNK